MLLGKEVIGLIRRALEQFTASAPCLVHECDKLIAGCRRSAVYQIGECAVCPCPDIGIHVCTSLATMDADLTASEYLTVKRQIDTLRPVHDEHIVKHGIDIITQVLQMGMRQTYGSTCRVAGGITHENVIHKYKVGTELHRVGDVQRRVQEVYLELEVFGQRTSGQIDAAFERAMYPYLTTCPSTNVRSDGSHILPQESQIDV